MYPSFYPAYPAYPAYCSHKPQWINATENMWIDFTMFFWELLWNMHRSSQMFLLFSLYIFFYKEIKIPFENTVTTLPIFFLFSIQWKHLGLRSKDQKSEKNMLSFSDLNNWDHATRWVSKTYWNRRVNNTWCMIGITAKSWWPNDILKLLHFFFQACTTDSLGNYSCLCPQHINTITTLMWDCMFWIMSSSFLSSHCGLCITLVDLSSRIWRVNRMSWLSTSAAFQPRLH